MIIILLFCFRLTPPYMLFLMLYVPLFKHWGDGPFWLQTGTERNECNETWWTNLLYVNNLVKTDKMVCVFYSFGSLDTVVYFVYNIATTLKRRKKRTNITFRHSFRASVRSVWPRLFNV